MRSYLDIRPAGLGLPAAGLHRLPEQGPGHRQQPPAQLLEVPGAQGSPSSCGPDRILRRLRPVVGPGRIQQPRHAQQLPEHAWLSLQAVLASGWQIAHIVDLQNKPTIIED